MRPKQDTWESRQVIAVVGILLTGLVAALTLPAWMAAACLLIALCAIRSIAGASGQVLEPVVIRREELR